MENELYIKEVAEGSHILGSLVLPPLLERLGIKLLRSLPEEGTLFPKLLGQVDTLLHQACYLPHTGIGLRDAVGLEVGLECIHENLFVTLLQIVMVEPQHLLYIEAGTVLRAVFDVERVDELLHGHHLVVVAGIPAQKGQEVDHGLGQIAALAIAGGDLSDLGVFPLKREHRETEAVAIAFA